MKTKTLKKPKKHRHFSVLIFPNVEDVDWRDLKKNEIEMTLVSIQFKTASEIGKILKKISIQGDKTRLTKEHNPAYYYSEIKDFEGQLELSLNQIPVYRLWIAVQPKQTTKRVRESLSLEIYGIPKSQYIQVRPLPANVESFQKNYLQKQDRANLTGKFEHEEISPLFVAIEEGEYYEQYEEWFDQSDDYWEEEAGYDFYIQIILFFLVGVAVFIIVVNIILYGFLYFIG